MKIIKKLIILIIVALNFSMINNAYANIIEQEKYLVNDNWVYLWIKKLDEQKLESLTSTYVKNTLTNWFNTNQRSLTENMRNYDLYKDLLYKSLYYDLNLSNTKEVLKVKDYLWNDMSFSYNNSTWINNIKIYYESFFDIIWKNQNWENLYKNKYNDSYKLKSEKIIVEYLDWTKTEFNFRFNIPKLNFSNQKIWNNIILNQNNEIILEINNLNSNNLNVQWTYWLENIYEENRLIWRLVNNPNYHIWYNMYFYNWYDIYYEEINLFNEKACNNDDEVYYYPQWNKFILWRNNSYYTDFYNLNLSLIQNKSNGNEEINNIEYYNDKDELIIYWLSDWVYKLNIDWESYWEKICREIYSKEIKTSFRIWSDLNNNWVFYYKDNLWWSYAKIEKLFYYLNQEINFSLDWKYYNFGQFIEKLDFNVKDINWNLIYEWNKECINSWNCTYQIQEIINEGWYNEVILEIKYKDAFSEEEILKKVYDINKRAKVNLDIFTKWNIYTLWKIDIYDNLWFNNLMFLDDKNIKLNSIKIEENDLNNIWDLVEQKLIDDWHEKYDDEIYIEYMEIALQEIYWEIIIYTTFNDYWELIIPNSFSEKLNTIEYYLDDIKNWEINVKNILDEYNYEWLNLINISKKYIQLSSNTIDINKIELANWIQIRYKNNTVESVIKIEEDSLENNYYWFQSSYSLINEEVIFNQNNWKPLYYLDQNNSKIYLFISIDDLYNIENINYSFWENQNLEFNKYRIFDEKTNFSDLEEWKTKIKSSENWSMWIYHNFIENIEWTLFIREVNIYQEFISDLDININITWENIKEIDYSKIYACNNYIENIDEIENMIWCYNIIDINFYWMQNVWFILYIYWLEWLVNDDFERINIEFNIKKMEEEVILA